MREKKKCAFCGTTFIAKKGTQKYCSAECRNKQQKIIQRQYHREHAKRKKDIRKQKETDRLNDKIRAAREAGMSYGKYMATQYMKSQ